MGRVTYIRPDMESMLKTSMGGWSAPTPVMLYRMGMSLSLSDLIWDEEQRQRVSLWPSGALLLPSRSPCPWSLCSCRPEGHRGPQLISVTVGTCLAASGQGLAEPPTKCPVAPGNREGQDTVLQVKRLYGECGTCSRARDTLRKALLETVA